MAAIAPSGLVTLGGATTPRVRVAAPGVPAALPRLAVTDPALTDPHWIGFHEHGMGGAPFDLAALGPIEVTLCGHGLILREGALLDDPSILPAYVLPSLAKFPGDPIAEARAKPVRTVGRPALVFHGWGVRVYGHFLIEMLPKLLLAARFPALFGGLAPVLDRQMPDWFIAILRDHLGLDPARAIWFDSAAERLHLTRAVILPLLAREGGWHAAAGPLFDDFTRRHAAEAEAGARLFVARGDFANPAAPQRRYPNEAEIAEIAATEFGFEAIRPETLAFPAQIRRFAAAGAIVGHAGSGMHNAIFAPAGARVGMIRFTAPDQSAIAALRCHRIAYLTAGVAEAEPGSFIVDPEIFRRFLAALLAA